MADFEYKPDALKQPEQSSAARESSAAPAARRFRYSEPRPPSSAAPHAGALVADLAAAPAVILAWQPICLALLATAFCILLFYPSDLYQLVVRWASDSGWSHGFVVPLIALFFVRLKWDTLRTLLPQGSWWGLAILLVGVCGQILFRATGLGHMSNLSIIVVLFGIVLFVFGWEYLKIAWLPIAYLAFAVPPPTTLYVKITTPMQMLAAELAAHIMPLFGGDGQRRGTLLDVAFGPNQTTLNVEQACSGMRMLVAFFALAVALAYSTDRPVWQKLTLAVCALPIAIICNGFRVALTGVMALKVDPAWAKGNAHEYFGMLMLGPALVMQLGIGWVLDRLFVEVPDTAPQEGIA